MTPDPLGGDITNPQSLNRYAYALNSPATNTDASGLVTIPGCGAFIDCAGGGGGGFCDPVAFPCGSFPPFPPVILPPIGGGLVEGSGGGGTGGSTAPAAPPAASSMGPLSGPTLGPPGLGFESTVDVIEQVGPYASPWIIEVTVICASDPACLSVLLGAGAVVVDAREGGLRRDVLALIPLPVLVGAAIYQAKGGKQGVGHDYVRDQARRLAKELNISYCEALQRIYQAARAAGDFKKANDTKATQKEDGCSGH